MTVQADPSPDRTRLTDQWLELATLRITLRGVAAFFPSVLRGSAARHQGDILRENVLQTEYRLLRLFSRCLMTAQPFQLVVRSSATLAIAFVMAACASAPAPGGPSDVPVIRRDTVISVPAQPRDIPAASVPLNYGTGTFGYDLMQTTVVTVGTDSLGTLQDTLVTRASLTYSIQRPGDTLRVIGIVDSLSVSSTRDSLGPRLLATPVTVTLEPATADSTSAPVPGPPVAGVPVDSTLAPATCDRMEDAARTIVRDALIRLPANAQPRQRWMDSASVSICRGGIPMTATTVSNFEIQDIQARGDSLIVQIIRQSTLTLAGTGTQGVRRITVSGSGTSETRFAYELRGGVFLESQGQSVLQLRFETIQQTEQVTQRSTSSVRRRLGGS